MIRSKPAAKVAETAKVYCPMCTHTVEAEIRRDACAVTMKRRTFVAPGQKCPHCSASLDAGYIFSIAGRAA